MSGDCRSCRDWTGCLGKDFFSYAEIQFCTHQIYWLIKHAETLRGGEWPDEPDDNPGSEQFTDEATFTKAILIIAEVDYRLKQCGTVADHLVDAIEWDVPIQNLRRNPKDALYYISGWNRKGMPFKKWQWQKYHREDKISSKLVGIAT